MQRILILTATSTGDNFEATHITSDTTEYLVFNDIEYAAGYIYACKKEHRPEVILIDHDLDLIERFVKLCTEINVDMSKFRIVTNTGENFSQVDIKKQKFIYINPIPTGDNLNHYLVQH